MSQLACKYVCNCAHLIKKRSEFIYRLYCSTSHSRRLGTDHTVLPANYTVPASTSYEFTRWRIPRLRLRTSNCSRLLIYLSRKDERLSRPGWLTYSGRFTHISGHPSAAGRAQDSESSPVRDRCSTTVPRNQPMIA